MDRINGEKTDTSQMQEGQSAHKRVDDPKHPAALNSAVTISSKRLGLTGRCDAIEPQEDGSPASSNTATRTPQRIRHARPQGAACPSRKSASKKPVKPSVSVRCTTNHKTVPVDISDEDIRTAEEYVHTTRALIDNLTAPQPPEDSPAVAGAPHLRVPT